MAKQRGQADAQSATSAWRAVVMLMLLYCISFIDRLILSLLATPLGEALQISDTQMGLLFGAGFGVTFAIVGLPIGHLIDRSKRVPIVVCGVVLWSLCTIASAFAQSYGALLALRAGVAIGEAVLSPAAISIIADLFPREKRTAPTTMYMAVATFMGAGAFIVGGAALDLATMLSATFSIAPWRLTLVLVGAPGLLLALLFGALVREPARREDAASPDGAISARQALAYVGRERLFYGFLFLAIAAYTLPGYAKVAWIPTLLVRTYGLTAAEAGYLYGTIGIFAGMAGAAFWPAAAKAWTSRGRKDATMLLFTAALAVSATMLAVFGLTDSLPVALICAAVALFAAGASSTLPAIIVQAVAPARMRARVMAACFMVAGIIGFAIGPPLTAFVGERFFSGPQALGAGLAAVSMACGPIGAACIWLARRRYVALVDAAAAAERAGARSGEKTEAA